MTDRALAAYIAGVLKDEPNGLPCATIAKRLGTRPATVRAVLRSDSWFVRTGSTSGARWHLAAVPSRSVPFRPVAFGEFAPSGRLGASGAPRTQGEPRDLPSLSESELIAAHGGFHVVND